MPLGLGQNDPVERTAPKNASEGRRADVANTAKQPVAEQDRIRYGVITAVNNDNMVKVRLLNNDGVPTGEEIVNGVYLPLMTPLSQVFLLWGSLRAGLLCRVFWRGKLEPDPTSVIEIIADESHNFLKKEPETNELGIGPYKIFSGGLSI